MTNQQLYDELLHLLEKEAKAEAVRCFIRQNYPEPYASEYCRQFDDAKSFIDFLEFMEKQIRKG